MQRIRTLLQKITDLSRIEDKATIIDIDLMMDYTRVLYADLAELRNRIAFNDNIPTLNREETNAQHHVHITKQAQSVQIKKMEEIIGINDKYLFISELFSNNKAVYDESISTLDEFDSYTQAINWLQSSFNWEDDNETVQNFYNLLNLRYSL